jgi:glycosyltransferase involved in cell wall biosynthesis
MEESAPELSVVLPCLNEADTIASCIRKAQQAFLEHGIQGEVVVADNGSTDGSQAIAEGLGAHVVPVPARGYGNALMGGIAAARSEFILMGDADDSYDFLETPKFLAKLREGFELVQGCRLPSGGGRILPGAMPLLHRWGGNQGLSLLARRMFRTPVHDVYCGLRGFTKSFYHRMNQRCTGMEFATEMIVKASIHGARITEVPITLHPDGRTSHLPHLRTFRDGWRTLRFYVLYSPRWLFYYPGALLMLLGLVGYGLALPGVTRFGVTFDAHTLLFSTLFILIGYQSILFAIFARSVAANDGLLPESLRLNGLFRIMNLERGLVVGGLGLLAGIALLLVAVNQWRLAHFGRLDYAHTMRVVIPGVLLTALGVQTILSSFFVSVLRMGRK